MTDGRGCTAEDFIRAMLERDALLFGDFVLKSGRKSPYFFNLGAVADGAGHDVVGKAYANEVAHLPVQPDVLFGPAYKGIPIAVSAAVALARDHGVNVEAAFNRKEAKTHGEGGTLVGASMAGSRVVIVDDVVTDGAAKREAHETITAAGGEVVGIVLALDRQEPSSDRGETALAVLERELEVPVRCVAKLDDVVRFLAGHTGFTEEYRRMAVLRILQVLNERRQRATYGAVGNAIGVNPKYVGRRYLGDRRPEASWIVLGNTGKPRGYAASEMHADLFSNDTVLRTGAQLNVLLGWASVQSRPDPVS